MATDKVLINRNTMTGIANAIRSKNESQTLYRPGEMADAIRGIKGGDMSSVESVAISNKADLAEVWLDTPYASLPLEVSVLPADAPQFINVTSSNTDIVGVRRNDDGTYVVRPYATGTATITVSDYSGKVTDSVTMTIGKHLTAIAMANTTLELVVGVSRKLTVNLTPTWATDTELSWSSSDPDSVSVDQNGNVVAHKHCSGVVITATAREGTLSTKCTIGAYVNEDEPDWNAYRQALKNDTLELQPGDTITIPWTDKNNSNKVYDFEWRVVHVGDVEVEGGATKRGMTLMAVRSLPFGTPFNQGRRVVADEETAQGGVAYYGVSGSTYTKLELIEGDPLPRDQYTNIYKTDLISDKMTGSLFNTMTGNGLNRWKTSALRQYLNTDADPNQWYVAKYISDNCSYVNKYGFLAGFSPAFVAALATTKVQTVRNTAIFDGETDVTYDRMFLPSREQVYMTPYSATYKGIEGTVWDYYKSKIGTADPTNNNTDVRKIIPLNATSANTAWLRSAYLTYVSGEYVIYSNGGSSNYGASASYYAAPACVIVESD